MEVVGKLVEAFVVPVACGCVGVFKSGKEAILAGVVASVAPGIAVFAISIFSASILDLIRWAVSYSWLSTACGVLKAVGAILSLNIGIHCCHITV